MDQGNVDEIERILLNLPDDSIDAIMMKLLKAKMSKRDREATGNEPDDSSAAAAAAAAKKPKGHVTIKSQEDDQVRNEMV
ncbi:hypothetical protein GUITHDRAFT_115880 [Guillardia theta CCMP2712]|uniref:Uncharacterized protein n=1 Tax=Guillardia theta (strain CCMP2712) TaxID=905079 RepID=L1INP2_GUITC|nr:hypothetical protein GUITHDRAFT_115880 [Guillardia theta CCMP2712]EKX37906.1 hypothetical protein GUITHDRAFT_115880 [Guillardia theta CCMP2712]|eukprot:XP_005824886.1 hypothetical protein GUITHDRAFT_115880 [Guillardia theta CCMP2712]